MYQLVYKDKPKEYDYYPLPDRPGYADIYIRSDIARCTDEDGGEAWSFNENQFRAKFSEEYVAAHIAELIDYEPPKKRKLTEVEELWELVSELSDAVIELAALIEEG